MGMPAAHERAGPAIFDTTTSLALISLRRIVHSVGWNPPREILHTADEGLDEAMAEAEDEDHRRRQTS